MLGAKLDASGITEECRMALAARDMSVAFIAIGLGALACGAGENRPASPDLLLTRRGLGPVALCSPIDSIATRVAPFASGAVRDTTFTGEDESQWRGRTVTLRGGGTVDFESSWADSSRVWRASATARGVRTAHGARVGDVVDSLPAGSGPVTIEMVEGEVVLELTGDGVGALVDSAAAQGIASAPLRGGRASSVPRGARIRRLVVAGDCGVGAAAR